MDTLPEDAQEPILNNLEDIEKEKLFFINKRYISLKKLSNFIKMKPKENYLLDRYLNILKNASGILKNFTLRLDKNNFEKFATYELFREVRLRNISVDFKGFINFGRLLKFLKHYENSVENLQIQNAKFKNFKEFSQLCGNSNIKSLSFQYCGIDQIGNESLQILETLKSISFNKCNDNIYRAFKNQTTIAKIEVSNEDWTWNGFPHDVFNSICKSSHKSLQHLVLNGAGTGSYFDADEFPYKITKLKTSMITFHWYVGIKTERVCFLRSQCGNLKDLTIHQLPNDFDGGRVLKHIFEEMNLETFYYGKIPLILKGKKQNVTEISGTEIQIRAAMELINQYPSK